MTFKEWVEKNIHDDIDPKAWGGVPGCPYNYLLESEKESVKNCNSKGGYGCDYCWNREMPTQNRERCPLRHENGNCLSIGRFCTAVNDSMCRGLRSAYEAGMQASLLRDRHGYESRPELMR